MAWHLLHPAIVHFALAFLLSGVVCELVGMLVGRPRWAAAGARLVLAGTIALALAVASGFLAANTVRLPQSAAKTLEWHERSGLGLLAVFLLAALWKAWFRGRLPQAHRPAYGLWLLAGGVLVGVTAWLGAELVYLHGVGVGLAK